MAGVLGGRPPHYETPEEISEKIDEYFQQIKKKPTITGLALFLGFASRQTIHDYKKDARFSYILKRAVLLIEQYHEERLSEHSCTGSIFFLKNQGWIAEESKLIKHDGALSFNGIVISNE